MPLESYRKKRNLDQTPEPVGRVHRTGRKRIFVVQKHAASHLHYDFRLEIGGVLVSWAVPKGPTLDPSSKRFATMTEDHPIEYAEFEGAIPEGHYGAGWVIVWDKGNFEPQGDLTTEEQLAKGELKFELEGKKLRGAFVLVHMGRHSVKPGEKSRWLLIKRKDQWADSQWKAEAPRVARSVLTGRTWRKLATAAEPERKPLENSLIRAAGLRRSRCSMLTAS